MSWSTYGNRAKSTLRKSGGSDAPVPNLPKKQIVDKEFREERRKKEEELAEKKAEAKARRDAKRKLKKFEEKKAKASDKKAVEFDDLSAREFADETARRMAALDRMQEVIDTTRTILKRANKENQRLRDKDEREKWQPTSVKITFHNPTRVRASKRGYKEVTEFTVRTFEWNGRKRKRLKEPELCFTPPGNSRTGYRFGEIPAIAIKSIAPVAYAQIEEKELAHEQKAIATAKKVHPNAWHDLQNPTGFSEYATFKTQSIKARLPKWDADNVMKGLKEAFENKTSFTYDWQTEASAARGRYDRQYGHNEHTITVRPYEVENEDGTVETYVKAHYHLEAAFRRSSSYYILNPTTIMKQ